VVVDDELLTEVVGDAKTSAAQLQYCHTPKFQILECD
jgi:hypothetical protein